MNEDTLKLLQSCSYGVKMCIESFDEVLKHAQNCEIKEILEESRSEHMVEGAKIEGMLEGARKEIKDPNIMAKGMTWMKINFELIKEKDDEKAVASLVTDGCSMGVKLLNHYLNDYECADENVKEIVLSLIKSEEKCKEKISKFL